MQVMKLNSPIARAIAFAFVFTVAGGAVNQANADQPPPPKPELTIRPGNDFGVAPTLVVPLRNGGQLEFKGPDLHPQVQPSLNGGSVTVTLPLPESRKK